MTRGRVLGVVLLLAFAIGDVAPVSRADSFSVVEWLDAYRGGHHDRVVAALSGNVDLEEVLKQLRRDGPGWMTGGGAQEKARRELVAATFALEAARIGARDEWKWIKKQPPMCIDDWCYEPLSVLVWRAPPLLIEWGCTLLREDKEPRPAERWWQLAALAVAQYSEDTQFLVGDPNIGKGVHAGEIGNIAHEIKHLDHVTKRFPRELRFMLGQGIARDRVWDDDATQAYRALEHDVDVGAEALMRFGAMQIRLRRPGEALKSFDRAEQVTRDPYVIFLAHYFSAQVYERMPDLKQAEAAYRRAAAAVPHAQSATLALATLLARDGRRAEAQRLVAEMVGAAARPVDPWRRFVHADDRFWPLLIRRLRAEIGR